MKKNLARCPTPNRFVNFFISTLLIPKVSSLNPLTLYNRGIFQHPRLPIKTNKVVVLQRNEICTQHFQFIVYESRILREKKVPTSFHSD